MKTEKRLIKATVHLFKDGAHIGGNRFAHIKIFVDVSDVDYSTQSVCISCQIDDECAKKRESYGWRVEASEYIRRDIYTLSRVITFLKKFQRALDKLVAAEGRPTTFATYATQCLRALKVHDVQYKEWHHTPGDFSTKLVGLEHELFEHLAPTKVEATP